MQGKEICSYWFAFISVVDNNNLNFILNKEQCFSGINEKEVVGTGPIPCLRKQDADNCTLIWTGHMVQDFKYPYLWYWAVRQLP